MFQGISSFERIRREILGFDALCAALRIISCISSAGKKVVFMWVKMFILQPGVKPRILNQGKACAIGFDAME